jgi:hypothetical protein
VAQTQALAAAKSAAERDRTRAIEQQHAMQQSTLAAQMQLLAQNEPYDIRVLDLDVCISDEMKANFAKGKYPTLAERATFVDS